MRQGLPAGGERGINFRKSARRGLECACRAVYTYVHVRASGGEIRTLTRPSPKGERGKSAVHFGGGRVPLVLNPVCLDSTRTLFLHREGRVETGGSEFNRRVEIRRKNDEVRMTNGRAPSHSDIRNSNFVIYLDL